MSGSSVVVNLADLAFVIEKPNIRVIKNREFGDTGLIQMSFDPASRRIFETKRGDLTHYGWDHTGIELPENPAKLFEMFQIKEGEKGDAPF